MSTTPKAYSMPKSDGTPAPLCTDCALQSCREFWVLFQIFGMVDSLPESMDDAIATLMLMDAVSGKDFPVPEPYAEEFTCAPCGRFIPAVSEVA